MIKKLKTAPDIKPHRELYLAPYLRKVQFYETDRMGIVHHSNYIRWFEEARVDFMEKIGYTYSRVSENGIEFPVLEVASQYKGMVYFEQVVAVDARITSLTPSRFSIGYVIKDYKSAEVRTTGMSSHCFYSTIHRRPVSLKRELPELYELFESWYAKKA